MNPETVLSSLIPHRTPVNDTASAFAPSNIALCKYWGKRQESLKLPVTGSLSVSLGPLGTRMDIVRADRDGLWINEQEQQRKSNVASRFFSFLNLLRPEGCYLQCHSTNTVPTGAGLASSASAFAATVRAMDQLFAWELPDRNLSILARIGSGSACRSIFHGFVEWQAGTREDGLDSFATPLEANWPEFRIGLLTVSSAPKPVGSTEGMRRTMETAPLYRAWPDQVARDLPRIREAVLNRDFPTLGSTAEQNAMSMHATMIAAWPPVIYWQPESLAVLHRVRELRESGTEVYVTMDAGPNVKLLFLSQEEKALLQEFPALHVVTPFPGA